MVDRIDNYDMSGAIFYIVKPDLYKWFFSNWLAIVTGIAMAKGQQKQYNVCHFLHSPKVI